MAYTEKYVISPIDNKTYCRANGQFKRHLIQNGYRTYQDFWDEYHVDTIVYCNYCNNKAVFNDNTMCYKDLCIDPKCRGRKISNTKSCWTEDEKQIVSNNIKYSLNLIPDELRLKYTQLRRITGHTIGVDGLTSYQRSVQKREKTCLLKYNDTKYNNSIKASTTKLNWSEERKQQFLTRVKKSLGGKWLNSFITKDTWIKRKRTRELLGYDTPNVQLTEWQQYRRDARLLTTKIYNKHKHIINPLNLPRGLAGVEGAYHLDHIVPISHGFVYNIPVDEIAGINNLQMIPWLE